MFKGKSLLTVLATLTVVLFLAGLLPGIGTAAPAKAPSAKSIAAAQKLTAGQEFPVTGKEYLEWSLSKRNGLGIPNTGLPNRYGVALFNWQPPCILG